MSLQDYLHETPQLTTGRLLLRALQPADVADLRQWTPDPELYRYWGKGPGKADKDPALLFAAPAKPSKSFHWGIQRLSDRQVIGQVWVYLIENDRMAKLAIRLARTCQGQGLGSEALGATVEFCFTHTQLQRLWSDVDVRNAASCRMLEKCGFVQEGCIRQGKMVSTWCDYYLYGLLRQDWQAAAANRRPGKNSEY